jgi:hypothetical protein
LLVVVVVVMLLLLLLVLVLLVVVVVRVLVLVLVVVVVVLLLLLVLAPETGQSCNWRCRSKCKVSFFLDKPSVAKAADRRPVRSRWGY